MKKFLSLVLALAMTMSLVTISAGAEDFTDADDITYAEAVEVMTAIGVVGGYADGSFNPTAGLTRGAAAKIICNMLLGPTTAEALSCNNAPFKDVPVDNTFAGYIAYCSNAGIISGYADGTFKPTAPLTGYAFMKMLLGALGYDAAVEGYTGSNWSVQVAKRALNIELNDGLVGSFVGSKALNREEACLYAFNTLKATMVEYKNASTIVVGDISVSSTSTATVVNDENASKIWKQDNATQFAEKYFSKLSFDDGKDAFGRPAITWWYGVKNDDNKIGQFVNAEPIATFTGVTSEKEVYSAISGSGASATIAEVYEDGAEKSAQTFTKAVTNNAPYFGNGITVEIYDVTPDGNADPVYRLVAIRDYLAKVTSVTKADEDTDTERSVNITLQTIPSGFESKKVCEPYETELFARNDMVIVNVAKNGDEIVVKAAALAEKLENQTVTSYKTGMFGYVAIGGEKYSYSQNFTGDVNAKTYDMKSGDSYDFYLDSYGNIIDTNAYEATNTDYYRVIAVSAVKADDFGKDQYFMYKVVGADAAVSTVKMMGDTAAFKGNGEIVTMTEDDDNDGYMILKAVPTTASADDVYVVYGSSKYTAFDKTTATVNDVKVNNSTVFVIEYESGKFKAVTGLNNMDDYTTLTTWPTVVVDESVGVVVYMNTIGGSVSTSSDDLVYIVSDKASVSYDSANKKSVYTYTAVVDGELTTVDTLLDSVTVGLMKIKTVENGYVKSFDPITASTAAYNVVNPSSYEASFKAGVLQLTDSAIYVMADDAVVYHIDSKDNLTVTDAEALDGTLDGTAYVVMESATDKTVNAIYFDGTIK